MELKNRNTGTIPFIGTALYRDTGAKDQRYTNVYHLKIESPDGEKKIYVVKRPGNTQHSQPPAGNATPRGIHFWDASTKVYTVFANKIYADTTDLGVTLDASSGKCWFAETPSGFAGGQRLLVSDGTKLYAIQTDNTVTTISTSSDADFPTGNLGPVLFFDSYVVLAKSDGTIWNSDVDSFSSWTATGFLTAEMQGDLLEAIARQKDHMVAFKGESIEFFYDNANTPGSPFERRSNMALNIGLASKSTLAQTEDVIAFVGKQKTGVHAIWLMTGLEKLKKVSNPGVELIIKSEGSNLSNATAYFVRVEGQLLYVLNLNTADRTLVYNVGLDLWTEWADTSGTKFDGAYTTASAATVYMQDTTNGRVYTFSKTGYQDNGSNFTVTLLTDRMRYGTDFQKFCSRIAVIGDTTTGNLAVSFSDDDYANFNTARNIDMSSVYKFLTQLGIFRERSWKFTFTANAALRLEGYELDIRQGIR
jgi:hypothetical protein